MVTQSPTHTGPEARIREIFRNDLELDVENDTEVVRSGLLDSMAFVKLLVGLEREFGIRIDLAALDLEDFGTVEQIARLVSSKRRESS